MSMKKIKDKEHAIQVAALLSDLIEYYKVNKILNTFFKAFYEGTPKIGYPNHTWLHGGFNLGGTVSGRLSSSDPNMTNLPSTGSKYAKPTKDCFRAPEGWIFAGIDFASLEDRISALTTKDPNKLKVYTDGYDGHCLRAYSYFGENMPDIDPNSVESINSIAELYPKERQDSKGPTFLLTYKGTEVGMVKQFGMDFDTAKQIKGRYHDLYKISDEWVQRRIDKACKVGYVTTAFGLRLRTPLLSRTELGKKYTPYKAEKEARTAGNALGQGYCMLTSRASNEFMRRVWASPYRYDIRLICLIHDAIYLLIRDNPKIVAWANKNIVECMDWQELPEIKHDDVKIFGRLEIFYPSWAYPTEELPPNASPFEIKQICKRHKEKLIKEGIL